MLSFNRVLALLRFCLHYRLRRLTVVCALIMPLYTPPPTHTHTRANSHAPPSQPKPCQPINVHAITTTNSHSVDRENIDYDRSPNSRGDKRRRVHSRSSRPGGGDSSAGPSPAKHQMYHSYSHPSHSPDPHPQVRRVPNLAPIKPIGFSASRESRREDGADHPIPSPVVMGFDFKQIDEDQLKTVGTPRYQQVDQAEAVRLQVRDTISIREQQQALIAQRRKDVVASTPATPKELTFKGWQPKDPERLSSTGPLSSGGGGGVGKRREKTREKVEGMTINTGMHDKDGVLGSKARRDEMDIANPRAHP